MKVKVTYSLGLLALLAMINCLDLSAAQQSNADYERELKIAKLLSILDNADNAEAESKIDAEMQAAIKASKKTAQKEKAKKDRETEEMNLAIACAMSKEEADKKQKDQNNKSEAQKKEEVDCTICLEKAKNPFTLGCNKKHTFCKTCIGSYISSNLNTVVCPFCRMPISEKDRKNATM